MQVGLSPIQSGSNFDVTIRECERAEAMGFDSIWLGEHHNHALLYPTPLIGLAAIASRTQRLRLGTGVLLLPLYHPLAVAEEGAMVDMISGGRLILGLGAGYAPEEFAAFGLTPQTRGSRLEEGAALLRRLWSEEHVSHNGRHYQVTDVTIGPRPTQQPRPPIWFAGWVEPAIRRAARLGDAWIGGPSARLGEVGSCVNLFQQARREAHPPAADADIALIRYVFVGDNLQQAYDTVGNSILNIFETTYFRWPHPVVKRPAGMLTIEQLAADRLILGDPAQCIEQIRRFRDELGLTHLICRISFPGVSREASLASLQLFARDVLPALQAM
jgi:probable F420-dependent oxidoreductase